MGDSEVPVKCEKRVKRDDKQDMSTAWNLIFLWINERHLLQCCSVVIWMVKVYTSVEKSPTSYSTEINLKQNIAGVRVGAAPCNG